MPRHEPVTTRLDRARALSRTIRDAPADAANENRICPSIAFLAADAFPRLFLSRASRHAIRNGTSGAAELLAHGLVSEDAYYRSLANHAGVAFVEPTSIAEVLTGENEAGGEALSRQAAWCRLHDGSVRPLFAPTPDRPGIGTDLFRARIGKSPDIAITAPSGLRAALARQIRRKLGHDACNRLATENPWFSAKHGAGAWHGFMTAGVVTGLAGGLAVAPAATLLALHGAVTLFFLATVTLRLFAAATYRFLPPTPLMRFANSERPLYSVVVALHREAPVVADLITALKALRWPRAKLEIKLVCEEGDRETLAALARERLDRRFEIVTVPLIGPQTKPKALNFALPFSTGSLITLYDAEDRPHPDQLEEAWQVFRQSDATLGALQAPLIIANPRRNWLTTHFHLEYAALFRGILQLLTRHGLPVPLGGTSTHFRRAAIEDCGSWDPYNVTEDADLGFRLWRKGYRVGLISRPTLEDAPDAAAVWLRQRTRWIKGWIQTWVVHSRRSAAWPAVKRFPGAAIMHLLLAGTVACALFYPFTVLTVAVLGGWSLYSGTLPAAWSALAVLDWSNILLAFAAHAALGLRTIDRPLRPLALKTLPLMPVYWLLGALAGWRAVRQYFSEPFLWEKTPHRPHDPSGEMHHV
ncbi:glycosyltransferase family 2 protein [Oricola nitratireducens]|uniref:glycosyltransferase family 2 protein n=1 Tax=Oricola nitratireducens TaxID=2775868 RepID=UPI0018660FEA|nr:glycosyltransferase family 2 protein [Oricola nitratireducens]